MQSEGGGELTRYRIRGWCGLQAVQKPELEMSMAELIQDAIEANKAEAAEELGYSVEAWYVLLLAHTEFSNLVLQATALLQSCVIAVCCLSVALRE